MKLIYKLLSGVLVFLAVALGVVIIWSPYGKSEGFAYKLVKHKVHIVAGPDSVFRFLGNSDNARKWSVFVHHITPLNADSLQDGLPGSRRRCFCKADETGTLWDETILEVIPAKKRQLSCYALKDFPMTVDGIATEQLYEGLLDGTCNLTFTFFIKDRQPSAFESLKLYIGAFRLHGIFRRNLENIKAICEGHAAIHPREQ